MRDKEILRNIALALRVPKLFAMRKINLTSVADVLAAILSSLARLTSAS